jgi:hypothetical protein
MTRKRRIMFLAGKAFFLRGSDNAAVVNQRRSRVVIKR